MTVSIEQAQLHLADLVERVRAGEQVVITRDGQLVARLVAQPQALVSDATDRWSDQRERLVSAGVTVPPAGAWSSDTVKPITLDDGGPSASDLLVRDRRWLTILTQAPG